MSADVDKRILDLLETTCVRKSTCAFCGVQLWFCRNDRTRKLKAFEASGRDHFATTHVAPGGNHGR